MGEKVFTRQFFPAFWPYQGPPSRRVLLFLAHLLLVDANDLRESQAAPSLPP